MELLQSIDRVACEEPGLSAAALLERFRDTKDFTSLEKLLAHNHLIKETGLERYYQQTLATLEEQQVSTRISELLSTPRSAEGDPGYRERLASLFERQRTLRQVRENR